MAESLQWIQPLILLLALGTVIMLTLKQARELKRFQEEAYKREKIVTIIECGDSKVEREFKEGDYIGKSIECWEGATGIIVGIYALREEKDKARSK